jgi:hypothetical protein
MLDVFGMQQGGSQYQRLIAAFQSVFGATIFFGTDTQGEKSVDGSTKRSGGFKPLEAQRH